MVYHNLLRYAGGISVICIGPSHWLTPGSDDHESRSGADPGDLFGGGPIPEFILILKIYANLALIAMKLYRQVHIFLLYVNRVMCCRGDN